LAHKPRHSLVIGVVLSLVVAASAHAAIGDLDTSFGAPNGFVLTGQMGANLNGGGVLVDPSDPSGRIVVRANQFIGSTTEMFGLVRYLPSGALDHDFNGTGMNFQQLAGRTHSVALAMAPAPGGKLLIGGSTTDGTTRQFMAARFTDAGALDSSFDPTGNPPGTVETDLLGSTHEDITGLGLLSSSKIAAVGSAQGGALEYFRYTETGAVDLSPVADTFTGVTSISPTSMAVAPGDKVLVGGFATVGTSDQLFVARLLSDGTPDSTFGTAGITTFNVGTPTGTDRANAIALQPDGSVVIVGTADVDESAPQAVVARVTSGGGLDPGFGSGGVTLLSPGANKSAANAVALQPNGKVLVAGEANVIGEGSGDFALMRLNSNGTLDPTFGSGGVAIHSLVAAGDIAAGVALQPDGNVVLAGSTFDTSSDVGVARFLGGEVPTPGSATGGSDRTKPKISKLKLLTKRLRATLKVRVHLNEAGKVTIKVTSKKRTLATKTVRFTKASTKTIKIKLGHRARTRLANFRKPAIKLVVSATDLAGNKSKRTLSAKLKRR
jgi:uncharacterized delta-60 repeat protein